MKKAEELKKAAEEAAKKAAESSSDSGSDSDSSSNNSGSSSSSSSSEQLKVPAKRSRAASNVSKASKASSASKSSAKKARKTSADQRVPSKKKADSSDSSSSDSDSSDSDKKPQPKKQAAKATKKDSSSDSDSGSDSDSSDKDAKMKKNDKKAASSSSGSDEDSDSSSSSSGSGSDEKPANGATTAATKEEKKTSEPADENDPNFGKTELFVQGLDFNTDDNSLRAAFEPHGTLTKVKLIYNKGKAFVEFESHDQAKAALNALNEKEIDGRQVWIEFSGNPAGGYKPGAAAGEATTIFCGNLSFKSDRNSIEQFFGSVAQVKDVRVAVHEDGNPKGFAHIEFHTPDDAKKVMNELAGQYLDGRAVRLDLSVPRAGGGGGGGRGGRGGFGGDRGRGGFGGRGRGGDRGGRGGRGGPRGGGRGGSFGGRGGSFGGGASFNNPGS